MEFQMPETGDRPAAEPSEVLPEKQRELDAYLERRFAEKMKEQRG